MSAPTTSEKRYRAYLKAELEAAAKYQCLAELESDQEKADIFARLVESEMRHASRWAEKLGIDPESLRGKDGLSLTVFRLATRLVGTNRMLPILLRGEARDIDTYAADPEARDLVREERRHARELRQMVDGGGPVAAIRAEGRHMTGGGGSLRAAVLGVNDGLVSNFSLVMGVAGGSGNPDIVLLAGVAGLLAGAFSMAAGEYVSMRSQRDIYEHQLAVEEAELREWPEEEEEELVLIYRAKGLSHEQAESVAKQIMASPEVALETMAREELGLDPAQLGSPWGAAISSFVAFVAGAIVPILPYIFDAGTMAFTLSGVSGALALLVVGWALAKISGKSATWGALRMVLAGGAAAAVTFGVGRWIGVSIG